MLDSLRQERSNLLDAVRGVAILMVVLFHYFPTPLTNFGWTGVNLFFILSGFLIGGILIDYQASSKYYSTFYARRAFQSFRSMPWTWRSLRSWSASINRSG